ncbi:aminoacylase [Salegentibacter salinarum]|uniref:Aminoacylase n=1 Tax=Salegentibacter salinarum TaxID=447422 RepID=A0A2N0TV79_9FLAO|nr:D-aminoacylase [Salegentibacter salinarum]PKD18662.1 aminoacylase [Salegentibacter salinarum]SKB99107.1 N-acyl-D-amino-acid deacylase [Salegentibacter salinarum]
MKFRLIIPLSFLLLLGQYTKAQDYDLIIRNATVYNGLGDEPRVQDIAIILDKIVTIGDLKDKTAARSINANFKAVAPGFIDTHAHIENIRELPAAESAMRQGVSLLIGGADGGGPEDFPAYLDQVRELKLGVNVGYQVGHNSVRERVLGTENRHPSEEELLEMQELVAQAMNHGAFGLSTGLTYVPGTYSETEEVIALAKVAAAHGGFYSSHIRDESLGLIEAVSETIEIAEKADITVVLSHHKALGAGMWGASDRTLKMVDSANAAGLDVRLDQYPYTASSTGISALIPSWALAGGSDRFKKRLEDKTLRDSIEKGILYNIIHVRVGDELERLQFRKFDWKPELQGKTMEDWLEMEGLESTPVNAVNLIIEAQKNGGAQMIYHVMHGDDVNRIMKHAKTMIASDGKLSQPGKNHPHPRSYGSFPRVLGVYARDKRVLSLSEAIKKMTSMPADLLGLNNRGRILEGCIADLVIFDSEKIKDMATFEEPHQYPQGIETVIINGQISLEDNKLTEAASGKLLTSQTTKP